MSVVCECGGEEQDDEGQHDGEDGYEDGFGARMFDAAACGAHVEEMWRHVTRGYFYLFCEIERGFRNAD